MMYIWQNLYQFVYIIVIFTCHYFSLLSYRSL